MVFNARTAVALPLPPMAEQVPWAEQPAQASARVAVTTASSPGSSWVTIPSSIQSMVLPYTARTLMSPSGISPTGAGTNWTASCLTLMWYLSPRHRYQHGRVVVR